MNINNNNLLKYITIIFFFAFIFIIPIATLSTPDKKISEIENKILTPLPKLNSKTITDKSFMTNFDKYSADQFPLRSDFLKLKNYYNYIVGNRKFRDIYIGENDRLMEKFIFEKNIVDKNISQATKFSKYLYNNYGIKSTLMVIPTSIAFYDDELPSWAMTDNQKIVLNYIKSQIDILPSINYTSTKEVSPILNFYSPYDILNKYKDMPIYFNTDHHWTQLGARIAYEDMYGNASAIELLSDSNYKEVSKDFYGTYYSKALLPQIKGDKIYAYENFNNFKISIDFDKEFNTLYDKDKLKGKNKYQYFLHGDPAFALIEGNTNSSNEILIFKDSYAHNFIPFLTSSYKKIHVIDPRYYNIDVEDYLSKNKGISRVLFISNIQTFSSTDIYKNF